MYTDVELLLTAIAKRTSTDICMCSDKHVLFADWTGNAGGSTTCQSGHSQAPVLCIAAEIRQICGQQLNICS